MFTYIKPSRIRWVGHFAKLDPNEITSRILWEQINGTRRVGRTRILWKTVRLFMLSLLTWDKRMEVAAQNRNNWPMIELWPNKWVATPNSISSIKIFPTSIHGYSPILFYT